ncbi:U3 small nucleolar RNA-associated protein 18-like protein [Theileria parva strain Muguga]|uniref:U3 small nucleolar RNA-associated protein 18-like protein n=1 Tax=Theileria parva strain Muguga TaxID=333668 RepID=UPI001C61C457|nr:U3 small nucleolar RNA-associated protein 18-like protein [Theileria parva strain Muguga]EAN33048.2 U3 small nucleolar RNA-associated protein 18-like protein [Theileria parva strain Muguga]
MNMGERVWEDPDDAEAPGLEEPRWVQKRRLILKEGGSEAYLSVSGPLTRVKPSAFKTGSRFKITPVKPSKDSFKFSGEVSSIGFDEDFRFMSVLCHKEKGLQLYTVGGRERFKLKSKKTLFFDDFLIRDFAFKDNNILLIGKNKKLLKYDVKSGLGQNIFNVMVPRTEIAYKQIVTSKHTNYYAIPCVNTGTILVCDFKDNLLVHNFKMNSECAGLGFIDDVLISCDLDSNIYEFDVRGGKCRRKFKDPNSVHVTAFSTFNSNRNSYFATGTKSGYVNLYRTNSDKPFKVLDNLTTEITSLKLSEEFGLFSSVHKKNSVRLVYNDNYNVVANWPNSTSNLGRITALEYFQPLDTIVLGTRAGRIHFHTIKK